MFSILKLRMAPIRWVVRPPGFEPGSSAWQADVLTKLDYGRPSQSNFSNTLKSIPTKTEENIINTLIALKSKGKSEETIKTISYKLRQLARECDLNNPDEVKYYIANATNQRTKQPLNNATKHKFAVAYDHYCKIIGIQWTKPIYKVAEITPLIPTTENVNAIINHASKKYITIFTILKETGFAPRELANSTQKDIDTEKGIIRVKGVKGHASGTYKLKPHTAEMLRIYIHKHPETHPFPNPHAMSQIWVDTRRRASKKLCKPELEKIELRNLRNYSASTYYKSAARARAIGIFSDKSAKYNLAILETLLLKEATAWQIAKTLQKELKPTENKEGRLSTDAEYLQRYPEEKRSPQ